MNRIEDQWHQLKAHEIAGQMFEDEYDLAMAVIKGMETRSQTGGYTLGVFGLILPSYLTNSSTTTTACRVTGALPPAKVPPLHPV
ncbi:MAG TPA: hypothetical protein V6C78_20190 [Crinalium sp.]|jgi:hypothetical protein